MPEKSMLEIKGLTMQVKNTKKGDRNQFITLLDNISFTVHTDELTAIIGPSGGGKSSLLGAIAGFVPKGSRTSGKILFGGADRTGCEWADKIGYADQDDAVFSNFTVFQTILFAARFRFGHSSKKLLPLVRNLLGEMRLQKVANVKMSRISGGERKRTMIAVQLIRSPAILLLDEPTSGLDTFTAYKIIKVLKGLRDQIVVFTVHQPSTSIYNMIDKLILIDRGKCFYYGPASAVENYLIRLSIYPASSIGNVAETLIEICSEEYREEKGVNQLPQVCRDAEVAISNNRNIFFLNGYPSISHIALLLGRKIILEYTTLGSMLRNIFGNAVNYTIFICSVLYLEKMGETAFNSLTSLFNNIADPSSKALLASFIPSKEKLFGSVLQIGITMILTHNINVVKSTFVRDNKIFCREIRLKTYSPTSLYISELLFHVINFMVLSALTAVLLKAITSLSLNFIFLVTCVGPIASVIFGLFLASLSREESLLNVLNGSCMIVTIISPEMLSTINHFVADHNPNYFGINYITYLMLPYNIFYFNSLVQLEIYRGGKASNYWCQICKLKITDYVEAINFTKMWKGDIWRFLILFSILTFALGTLCINLLMMPNYRLTLNKVRYLCT